MVNIILAKPKFENSGYVRDMWTFDLDQNRVAGVVNQILSDQVAVRVGAEHYDQTGGFYYDPNHDTYYDSSNGFTARGQVRYRSGPLDVTLLIDGQDLELPTFVNSLLVPFVMQPLFVTWGLVQVSRARMGRAAAGGA